MRTGSVLMVAHGFPPAGGSGSNRALAFARYLPVHGWRPVVLTPDAAWAAQRDDGLLRLVPDGTRVIRTPSFEPRPPAPRGGGEGRAHPPAPRPRRVGRTAPLLRGARRHLGHLKRFPDAHLGWLPFAVAAGRREHFDVIYSSSGPFTSHLVGLLLHRLTHKPWLAELRDGWYRWNRAIFPDYPAWRDPIERRLEAAVVHAAGRVVLVTDRMAEAFRRQYAGCLPGDHFAVVPNGFDPALLPTPQTLRTPGAFEIVHTGALYYGRSIASLLAAVAALAEQDAAFTAAVRLTFVGTLDAAARAELEGSPLRERVRLAGQLDHAATLDSMRRAALLLLVANTTPGAEATVPGKLFEYLAVGRPVLAVAPASSSTADVLARTGGGYLASGDDATGLVDALRQAFADFTAGRPRQAAAAEVARYDRRALAGELARLFEQVLAGAARRV